MDAFLLALLGGGALGIIAFHFLWVKPKARRSGAHPGTINWPRIIVSYAVLIGGIVLGMLIWPSGHASRYQFGALAALISAGIAGTARQPDGD